MSVYWNWNNKLGSIECENGCILSVYQGNCLCVILKETLKKDEKHYQFNTFFSDISHLKKCIGLIKINGAQKDNLFAHIWKKWKLNTYYKESLLLAKYLTQAGYPVELYYEEVKE